MLLKVDLLQEFIEQFFLCQGMQHLEYSWDIIAEDVSKSAESYKNILLSTDPSNKEDFDEDNLWDWNGHDTLYKATVFIPVSTNILSGAATSGQKITGADAVVIEARNQQKERLKNYDPNGASKFE